MLSEVDPQVVDALESQLPARGSSWSAVWRGVRRSPSGMVGLFVLIALIAIALLAPVIAPYNPNVQVGKPFMPPSSTHLLGLDDGGYDIVSLLMWGLRVSLLVGFAATLLASAVGATIGIVAGFYSGSVDSVLMRITDYFLVIPALPLMIIVADVWSPSLFHVIVVIGVLSWTVMALVVRAQARSIRERVYVKRARSLGATNRWIIWRHMAPQLVPLIVANTVLNIAYAIFLETALAFLGLGDPTRVSLGTMIEHAFLSSAISQNAWWAIVPPGVLVAVIILACTMLGRTIEDAFNPRLRAAHLGARSFTRLRTVDPTP